MILIHIIDIDANLSEVSQRTLFVDTPSDQAIGVGDGHILLDRLRTEHLHLGQQGVVPDHNEFVCGGHFDSVSRLRTFGNPQSPSPHRFHPSSEVLETVQT